MKLSNSDTIMHGSRDPYNRIYCIELNPQSSSPASGPGLVTHAVNSAYSIITKRDLVQYLRRIAFRPVLSALPKPINAIYFATWTGLKSKLVHKQLKHSLSTTKGHLCQDSQEICSTKLVLHTILPETSALSEQDSTIKTQVRSNCVFIKAINVTGRISTDQTGCFPVTSSQGSKYLMVLYDHDSNAILCGPIKSCSKHKLLRSYTMVKSVCSARDSG